MNSATAKRTIDVSPAKVKANYIKMIQLLDARDDSMSFLSMLNTSDPLMVDAIKTVYSHLG